MRIKTLLQTFVAVAILIMLGNVAANWFITAKLTNIAQAQDRSQSASRDVTELLVLTHEYSLYSEERAALQWRALQSLIVGILEAENNDTVPVSPEVFTEAKKLPEQFQQLVAVMSGSSDLQSRQKHLLINQLLTSTQILADSVHRWSHELADHRINIIHKLRIFNIAALITVILILTIFTTLIVLRVLRPLSKLHQAVLAAAKGDLSMRCATTTNDEFGELSRAFDAMAVDIVSELRREITERKRVQDELQDKNSELERFAYTVSHDLKSPLITIQAYAGMVNKDLESGKYDRAQDDIKRIEGAAGKMTNLLGDLLELSRVGKMMSEPSPIDMNRLVKDVLTQLAGPIAGSQVEVIVQPDLPVVQGDRKRIAEVVQNLVENAIKYRDDHVGARVEIGTRITGKDTVFFVSDNGKGIDPRFHENIFGLFNKLDAKSEGTGVGLALVKRIIEVHGGRVWVESEGVGKGSSFCFTLL